MLSSVQLYDQSVLALDAVAHHLRTSRAGEDATLTTSKAIRLVLLEYVERHQLELKRYVCATCSKVAGAPFCPEHGAHHMRLETQEPNQ